MYFIIYLMHRAVYAAAHTNITAGQQGMSIYSCPVLRIHRQTDKAVDVNYYYYY